MRKRNAAEYFGFVFVSFSKAGGSIVNTVILPSVRLLMSVLVEPKMMCALYSSGAVVQTLPAQYRARIILGYGKQAGRGSRERNDKRMTIRLPAFQKQRRLESIPPPYFCSCAFSYRLRVLIRPDPMQLFGSALQWSREETLGFNHRVPN